ncbi:MAG: cyclopropane-fatty-acyl-phospholipid synthase [Alphaproteobacteria bacterium RIFCSPHIGHO2_12_FULL_63_12]|nr:MAG: cyclopropane-fatty-acyl-phospholipid synthase [Alphaproteobacteria bacterium RIFCSPHIGHO2_12_FULL_63_12]
MTAPSNDSRDYSGLPVFFRIACNMAARLRYGSLRFILPDGRDLVFTGAEETDSQGIILVRDFAFARRSVLGGDIGFFESYADGEWDSPSVTDVLYIFARNADIVKEAFSKTPLIALFERIRHNFVNKNTRAGSRRNIMAHYDLGNAFYEKWLDRTMTYSSARFGDGARNLAAAQTNKYRMLARSIDLKPGESVLEIGSGWGGFAEFAAREIGANVTGLTISPAQLDYARRRIQREGLGERVDFKLLDYRDAQGAFDKVASIEMFEAVGREYWPQYFAKVRDLLKPGGAAGIQTITIADRFFERYSRSTDFIKRYVFPGGMLPSEGALKTEVTRAGLAWQDAAAFGKDYAATLAEWRRRFLGAWDEIVALGFDDKFKKLWQFYLSYCEAGFKAATTDVLQIRLARP